MDVRALEEYQHRVIQGDREGSDSDDEAILIYCASVRKASADFLEKPEVPIEPITIASLLFGSYHVLFPIKFGDGLPCMWNSRAFQTHQPHPPFGLKLSKSMRLILCETSVPLPDVLAFDATLDNELGCPSILHMRFVDHHQSMLERQGNDEEDESALYFEAGPFQDAAPCYLLAINRAKERKQPLHKAMCARSEDMEQDIEPDTLWEDSSDTLAFHRKEHNEFIQCHLPLPKNSVSSSSPLHASSATQKSLFVENLLIAAENLCVHTFEILEKCIEKIVELAQRDSNRPGVEVKKGDNKI
ncbi:hypothetical protein I7I51_01353 [Histoplasma capsulatum]|uniref:Uncharacterized protein n=1 Tax=Ajellomyces capsulatus TaxID=5037 RepID=A0A8A1MCH5_AJECA|nr:hypothetical protein I7I51_01353 [Histoplasma capsulatum]